MLEDVDEVLETMRIEEEPPIDNKIEPIETFVESESATDFKILNFYTALSSTSTSKCLAPIFK